MYPHHFTHEACVFSLHHSDQISKFLWPQSELQDSSDMTTPADGHTDHPLDQSRSTAPDRWVFVSENRTGTHRHIVCCQFQKHTYRSIAMWITEQILWYASKPHMGRDNIFNWLWSVRALRWSCYTSLSIPALWLATGWDDVNYTNIWLHLVQNIYHHASSAISRAQEIASWHSSQYVQYVESKRLEQLRTPLSQAYYHIWYISIDQKNSIKELFAKVLYYQHVCLLAKSRFREDGMLTQALGYLITSVSLKDFL